MNIGLLAYFQLMPLTAEQTGICLLRFCGNYEELKNEVENEINV